MNSRKLLPFMKL